MRCSRIQRRRARATSGRSCSAARRLFFEADRVPVEEPPDCAAAAFNPSLAHRRHHFVQRHIGLFGNQSQQQSQRAPPRAEVLPPVLLSRDAAGLIKALQLFGPQNWR